MSHCVSDSRCDRHSATQWPLQLLSPHFHFPLLQVNTGATWQVNTGCATWQVNTGSNLTSEHGLRIVTSGYVVRSLSRVHSCGEAAGADDVCLYTDRLHDLLSSVFTDIFNTSFSSLEVFEERSAVFTLSLDRLLCDRDKTNVYFIFILTLSCGRKCPLSSSKRWIQYIQVSTRLLFQRVCPQCHS